MSALWGKKEDTPPERGTEGDQNMIGSSKKEAPMPVGGVSSSVSAPAMESPAKVNALLGKGSEFEGKLNFEGVVRVDGVLKGEIVSKDKVVIGEGARVEAEINVGTAIVSGEVKGNITAAIEIELLAPAKMHGNLKTPSLVIQKGVIFEGSCSMTGSDKSSRSGGSTPSSTP